LLPDRKSMEFSMQHDQPRRLAVRARYREPGASSLP